MRKNAHEINFFRFGIQSATHLRCEQIWSLQLCLRRFGKLPGRVRCISADGPCKFWRVRAQILLKDNVIGGDYKCHHAGQAILDRIGHEKDSPIVYISVIAHSKEIISMEGIRQSMAVIRPLGVH